MSIVVGIKTTEEVKERLERLAEKHGMKNNEIVEYLLILTEKYSLLEPNWKDKVVLDELNTYDARKKIDLRYSLLLEDVKETSKEKDRRHLVKHTLLKEYLHSMTPQERKEWIDHQIRLSKVLQREEYTALPEETSTGIKVNINGKPLIVQELLPDGMPKLEYNQDRLVRCETGFHTIGTKCRECELLSDCVLVREEQIDLVSRKDT